MAGYISEFQPYGDTSEEFIEVALPAGTDPSGYLVHIYMSDGTIYKSFPLGSSTGTMGGHDVYVIDASTPGFDDGGSDPTGNLYPDDAVALVDGDGNVQQFISYLDNTVTATEGPASGMTSTDAGSFGENQSLQSDDGGSTYYAQSSPNSGSIPACFATGTLISTPDGNRPVEELRLGDLVCVGEGAARPVRWLWSGEQALGHLDRDEKPVLIQAGALGDHLPARDLIVSGQHRIVVGQYDQLADAFDRPFMVPAKALTCLPGVRFMAGKQSITWHHLLCDSHEVIFANGLASETLRLGPEFLVSQTRRDLTDLSRATGRRITRLTVYPTALPCLTVGAARRAIRNRASRADYAQREHGLVA